MLIYFMSLHAEYLHFVMSAYVKQKKKNNNSNANKLSRVCSMY